MIPIDQTVLRLPTDPSGPPGNCFAACIASILEIPIDQIPQPNSDDVENWGRDGGYWERLAKWLRSIGWHLLDCAQPWPWSTAMEADYEGCYWIASGPGPRGSKHSVVCCGWQIAHDPHPSRAGLMEIDGKPQVERCSYLVPLDPGQWTPRFRDPWQTPGRRLEGR